MIEIIPRSSTFMGYTDRAGEYTEDMKNPRIFNIDKVTLENAYFRHVIHTGPHSQLVLMSLEPREDIGMEAHHVDQFLRIETGEGYAVLDGDKHAIRDGSGIFVPAGVHHNIVNTGSEAMKLYTLYAPANHIAGRIHITKKDAEEDEADESFGGLQYAGRA
jgi:mannose-6-phosphate isomerase-like protein (cupin superfamily)